MTIDLIAEVVENADKIEQNIDRSLAKVDELKTLLEVNPSTGKALNQVIGKRSYDRTPSREPAARNPYLSSSVTAASITETEELRKQVVLLTKKSDDRKRSLKLLYGILTAKEQESEQTTKATIEAKTALHRYATQFSSLFKLQNDDWSQTVDLLSEKVESLRSVVDNVRRSKMAQKPRSKPRKSPPPKTFVSVSTSVDTTGLLTAEISRLQSLLSAASNTATDRDEAIRRLQRDVRSLQDDLAAKAHDASTMQALVGELRTLNDEKSTMIKTKDVELFKLKAELSEAQDALGRLESDLAFKNEELVAVKEAYDTSSFKLEEQQLRQDLRKHKEGEQRLALRVEQLAAEVADLQRAVESGREALESLRKKADEKCRRLEEKVKIVEERGQRAEERSLRLEEKVREEQERVATADSKARILEERSGVAERRHQESTEKLNIAEGRIRLLQAELDSMENRFTLAGDEISELQHQKADLEDELQRAQGSLSVTLEKLQESETRIRLLERQKEDSSRGNNDRQQALQDMVSMLEQSVKTTKDKARVAEQALKNQEEKTKAAETALKSAEEKLKASNDRCASLENELTQAQIEMEEAITDATLRLQDTESSLRKLDDIHGQSLKREKELEEKLASAEKVIKEHLETIATLKQNMKQIEDSIKLTENELESSLKAEISKLRSSEETLKAKYSELERSSQAKERDLASKLDKAAETQARQSKEIEDLTKELTKVSTELSNSKAREEIAKSLQNRLDKLIEANAVLKGDNHDKQKDIENLHEELEVAALKADELRKELKSRDFKIENLEKRIEDLESIEQKSISGYKDQGSKVQMVREIEELRGKLDTREQYINDLEARMKELKYRLHQASTGSMNSEEIESLKKDNKNFIRKINQLFSENGKNDVQFGSPDDVYNMIKSNISVIGGSTAAPRVSQRNSTSHLFDNLSPEDQLTKLNELYNENQQLVKDSESLKTQMVHLKEVYLRNNPGANPDAPKVLAVINEFLEKLGIEDLLDTLDDQEVSKRLQYCFTVVHEMDKYVTLLNQEDSDDLPEMERERPPDLVELEEVAAMPEEQRLELALSAYQALRSFLDQTETASIKSKNKANYFKSLYNDLLLEVEQDKESKIGLQKQIEALEEEIHSKQTHFKAHLKDIILKFFESVMTSKDKNAHNPLLDLLTNFLSFTEDEKSELVTLFKKGRLKDKLKKAVN